MAEPDIPESIDKEITGTYHWYAERLKCEAARFGYRLALPQINELKSRIKELETSKGDAADPKIASPTKTILSPEQILDKAFLSMQERHGGFKELEEFKNSLEYGVYVAAILEYHQQFVK